MNSFFFSLLIVLYLILLPYSIFSQSTFGLNTGVTYNSITGDAPKDASYKRKIDLTAGAHFELNLSKDIIIGIGARYYRNSMTVTYDIGEKDTKDSFDVSFGYISIPLTFKVLTGSKHTYFSSGFDLKRLINADLKYLETGQPDADIRDKFQNFEAAIFAGFGGFIKLKKVSIGLELRYSHSLNNISKNNQSSSSGLPARFRFTGFQLLMFLNYSPK